MTSCRATARPNRGFTLVELLVVIGIIALLISILLPTLSKARESAQQVRFMAGVRELGVGYTLYHQDHGGRLMLGYTPASVGGNVVTVDDPVSGKTFGFPIADRYPWRLLPYVDDVWDILHLHGGEPDPPTSTDSDSIAFEKAYELSLDPTFGLNSIYLGGHAGGVFQGFVGPDNRPNLRKHVAFHASEIGNSSRQIVFSESRQRNAPVFGGPSNDDPGLFFVSPPFANGQRWKLDEQGKFELTSGMITGLPLGRNGDSAVVGFFDGHAERLRPAELDDMRMWAPRAKAIDYDFASQSR